MRKERALNEREQECGRVLTTLCHSRVLGQLASRLDAPRVTRVSLALVHKTTELGDFTPNNNGLFHNCPWRFGDTLTIVVPLYHVHCCLRARDSLVHC